MNEKGLHSDADLIGRRIHQDAIGRNTIGERRRYLTNDSSESLRRA